MSQWDSLIQAAAQKYNVDPKLIASVIHVESSGNPNAYNSEFGATGLTQIVPATAKALGVDPKTPEGAIEGAAKLLDENLKRYGNPEQAILAYHGGTDQANWGPKTQDYLRKISNQYGAPQVAQTAETPDAFVSRFGPRPTTEQIKATPTDDVASAFQSRFGARPAPTENAAQTKAPEAVATAPAPTGPQPGILQQGVDMATQGLQSLGAQGISNANAVGRGIMDALDAPSEWLASGAEASGLTGLLGKAGINMPTAAQQKQINIDSRAQYDAANPQPGIQGMASRVGGNLAGVMVPIAGAEAGLVQGGRALSNAVGNPQALSAAGSFLRGQGGLASRVTYNAAQGAAGGALLSGGQAESDTGNQALLGAALGGAVPVAGAALGYLGGAGKALITPFTKNGPEAIARQSLLGEAAKDPKNMAQNVLGMGDDASTALGRAGAGGRAGANFDELVPGSSPTLAQATGNAGIAALERAAMSRAPNDFAERQASNYAARNAYLSEIKGTPQTLQAAQDLRESQAIPMLKESLAGAGKADSQPVMDTIQGILSGPNGQRTDVVKALKPIIEKLKIGQKFETDPLIPGTKRAMGVNGNGLQYDVEQLYGIRKSINDQLENVSGRDNSAAQLASSDLIKIRKSLDNTIESAAPGFKDYLANYAQLSKPIDAQRYLQGLDLTDQTSQRITLNKVKSALNKIDKQRAAPGSNEAKSISDEQLGMLRNLHTDLQREANSSRGMALGSNTFQNFATNQIIDAMLPGAMGKIAPVTPGLAGGALGYALAGPVGAGIGSVGATQAAGVLGRALNAKGPEIEAQLINYLLNPEGGRVLQQALSKPTAAGNLGRRVAPVAPVAAPAGNNNR